MRELLTRSYLDHVARAGMPADALVRRARQATRLDAVTRGGECLTRPAFLDRGSLVSLEQDIVNLFTALTSLPQRLFGGDLGAFAGAVGLTPTQVAGLLRTATGAAPTWLGRVDLFHDGTAFRTLEVNVGSTIGGLDNAVLNQAFLTHPGLAEFVAANDLCYVDTMAALAALLKAECGVPPDVTPFVAAVDTPASFAQLAPALRLASDMLAGHGLDVVPCHIGQLELRDGHVWLDNRPVDVVYRLFVIANLRDQAGLDLYEPLLRAVERGDVVMFTPLDAHLYSSKAALALLSDQRNRALLPAATLTSLDRILPWTRMARRGPVTVDGESVDLVEHAQAHRDELVIKPTGRHGGIGVTPGWRTDHKEWRQALDEAMDGPFVVQRRIRPAPELFPGNNGVEPILLNWGAFVMGQRYAGTMIRGARPGSGDIINQSTGAAKGCCFHQDTRPMVRHTVRFGSG